MRGSRQTSLITSKKPQTAVSLLPAATEILAAVNAANSLVGRSHECDFPSEIGNLPVLTQPNLDASLQSRRIDEQVKNAGGPLFTLNKGLLIHLAPDLILTQATCQVCALDADEVVATAASISLPGGGSPRVLALAPHSLSDLFADIHRVGEAIDSHKEAAAVVAALQARCDAVRDQAAEAVQRTGQSPRVAIIEWLDPPMAAGNWVPDLVQLAGGEDALATTTNRADLADQQAEAPKTAPPAKSHWIDWADVADADPDVVLLTPCGFELERVVREARSEAVWPHLAGLRATHEGRLIAVDGHHLFNRPGPRLVDSLDLLAELLHPGVFTFETTKRFSQVIA